MPKKKQSNKVSVDFTGVEAGGGGRLLPEGPMKFEVTEVTEEEGQDSGQPYLKFTLSVVEGEYEGTKAYDNFSLQPQSLWKLRGFMEAAELETVDGPMEINLDDLVGVVVTADVIHEDYKGKPKHKIGDYPIESAEETTTSGGARKKTPAADPADAGFKVKDKVKFKDGKKWLVGSVIKVDGQKVEVKVGNDEYEMDVADLEAA